MVSTFYFLNESASYRNVLDQCRVHRTVTVPYKSHISYPMCRLCFLKPFQNNVRFHFLMMTHPNLCSIYVCLEVSLGSMPSNTCFSHPRTILFLLHGQLLFPHLIWHCRNACASICSTNHPQSW